MNRVVTISRQFGSGGRTVGRKLAEKLNIPCYDNEIIEKTAEESGYSKEYIQESGEYAVRGGIFANAFSDRDAQGLSTQDKLWNIQKQVISDLAAKGPCVIVGRCADYILKDEADCLRVFVYADIPHRAERIVNLYGEREDSPEKRLKDKDKRRSAYYNFYTDAQWGNPINYDIALNSGSLGIEKCVEIIADLFEK